MVTFEDKGKQNFDRILFILHIFYTVTFEDKRKQNFDKGQAELEKRRQMLQDQMRREEEARQEKERKEHEKRERQR